VIERKMTVTKKSIDATGRRFRRRFCVVPVMRKRGRCQIDQITPRMRLDTSPFHLD
jgi:hypothetical protein